MKRIHLIKVRAHSDNLAPADNWVNDHDKIEFVADGLGLDFRPFISSNHSQPMMLFDDFIHLLIREDMFLSCQQQGTTPIPLLPLLLLQVLKIIKIIAIVAMTQIQESLAMFFFLFYGGSTMWQTRSFRKDLLERDEDIGYCWWGML